MNNSILALYENENLRVSEFLAQKLEKNDPKLKVLDLSGGIANKDKSVARICIAASNNTILSSLDISKNELTWHAEYIEYLLKTNKTLLNLNLGGNKFEKVGVTRICEGLKQNTTLRTLTLDSLKPNALAPFLQELRKNTILLSKISLDDNDFSSLPKNLFGFLSENSWLEDLSISGSLKSEQIIELFGGLKKNSSLEKFRILSLFGAKEFHALAISLGQNSSLKEFTTTWIYHDYLSLDDLKTVLNSNLKKVKGIISAEAPSFSHVMKILEKNNNLETIRVDGILNQDGFSCVCSMLKCNKSLTDISFHLIRELDYSKLQEALSANNTLKTIDFGEQSWDDEQLSESILEALTFNTNIKKLIMDHVPYQTHSSAPPTFEDLEKIRNFFTTNKSVTELATTIDLEGEVGILCGTLPLNNTIHTLCLGFPDTCWEPHLLHKLFEGMKKNHAITYLGMGVDDEAVLFAGLSPHRLLQTFSEFKKVNTLVFRNHTFFRQEEMIDKKFVAHRLGDHFSDIQLRVPGQSLKETKLNKGFEESGNNPQNNLKKSKQQHFNLTERVNHSKE